MDKEYRHFLIEREEQRLKDVQLACLSDDLRVIALASNVDHSLSFQPPPVKDTPFTGNVASYFEFFEKYLKMPEHLHVLHLRAKKAHEEEGKGAKAKGAQRGTALATSSKKYKKPQENVPQKTQENFSQKNPKSCFCVRRKIILLQNVRKKCPLKGAGKLL